MKTENLRNNNCRCAARGLDTPAGEGGLLSPQGEKHFALFCLARCCRAGGEKQSCFLYRKRLGIIIVIPEIPCYDTIAIQWQKSHKLRPYERTNPSVGYVVRYCKGSVTRKAGKSIWQRGFYDHIVRDEQDYLGCAEYIENNPVKWSEDEYHTNFPIDY